MLDNEVLEDLVENITSWSNFYIIFDEESIGLVKDFQNKLDELDISSFLIEEGAEYDFEEGDCLLAISSSGEDDFILDAVRTAKANDVKVYGVCTDLKSDLAQLCDECIFSSEDTFKENTPEFLNAIVENAENQLKKEEYEITPAYYLGPRETVFIISDSASMVLAEELERNLKSKGFSITIISEMMEAEFKNKLEKGNSVIAISRYDDIFVLDMVRFAKSKGIFVLGMGQDFKSYLAKLSDEFKILSQVDELASILYNLEEGYEQTKVERAQITGPPNKTGGLLRITLLIVIIVALIILFVFKLIM